MIRLIQIQTTDKCCARCYICPHRLSPFHTNPNYMDDELFDIVLDNLKDFKDNIEKYGKISLFGSNEPLMDPKLEERAEKIFKLMPNVKLHISTNALLLTPERSDKLIDILSKNGRHGKIIITHQGINKEQVEWMMGIDYDKTLSNIIYFLQHKPPYMEARITGHGQSLDNKIFYFTSEQYQDYWFNLSKNNKFNMRNVSLKYDKFHNRAGEVELEGWNYEKTPCGKYHPAVPKNTAGAGVVCDRLSDWVHILANGDYVLCCIPSGELILTNEGYKQIEKIKKNDKVISNLGSEELVTDVFERYINEKIYSIKTSNYYKPILLTETHPILTLERKNKNRLNKIKYLKWVKPKNINRLDYIVFPKLKSLNEDKLYCLDYLTNPIYWIDQLKTSKEYVHSYNKHSKKIIKDNNLKKFIDLKINKDLLWVFGMYLAEGYTTKDNREIVFCLNKDEYKKCERIIRALKCISNFKYHTYRYRQSNLDLHITNKPLTLLFNSLFGKYSNKKYINHRLLSVTPSLLYKIIEGFLSGDGYDEKRRYRLITTSEMLTKQIYLILSLNGIIPSISRLIRQNRLDYFEITINKYGNKMVLEDDLYYYLPIKIINRIQYKGLVHNLEVENQQSYIYDIYLVHNCMDYFYETVMGNIRTLRIKDWIKSEAYDTMKKQMSGELQTPDNFICKRCMKPWG